MARGETEGSGGGRRTRGTGERGGAGKRAASARSSGGTGERGGAGKRAASTRSTGAGKRATSARAAGDPSRGKEGSAAGESSAPREAPDDALRRLGDRLEAASDAAERLLAQAAGEAAARIHDRVKPPPSGWQTGDGPAPAPAPSADVALLLQAMRELVPADLQQRLVEAVRELLLAIRALIDWYLARLEQGRADPVQVQDIPIL
jgi:hypothetical protein